MGQFPLELHGGVAITVTARIGDRTVVGVDPVGCVVIATGDHVAAVLEPDEVKAGLDAAVLLQTVRDVAAHQAARQPVPS